jgi:cytochrome c peroxidase
MTWGRARAVAALIALIGWAHGGLVHAAPRNAPSALLDFSPHEVGKILQHGPWPPPTAVDAGNRLSSQPQAIALGQLLFFDKRLSPDGRMACASCHVPAKAFGDGLARSVGREVLDRNAPSLWNTVHERWQGWDGASDSLWSQAIRPLLDTREMASNPQHVARVISADAQLACRWKKTFGTSPLADADATLVNAAKAIAAFNASLVSRSTPFDAFRDGLARGQQGNPSGYPLAAQRGARLFVGRGQCNVCHVGPMFSNGEFGDTGIPFFIRPGVVDTGRHGGITALKASPFNLQSRWSDGPDEAAVKTQHLDLQHRNFGEFKVPSLRNVADTAPYMHNGQVASLTDAVRHYSQLNIERLHADGEQILKPLGLTDAEIKDMVAFLSSLSDKQARDWRPKATAACITKKDIAKR